MEMIPLREQIQLNKPRRKNHTIPERVIIENDIIKILPTSLFNRYTFAQVYSIWTAPAEYINIISKSN